MISTLNVGLELMHVPPTEPTGCPMDLILNNNNRVFQSVKCPILGVTSGLDLGAMSSSPTLGFMLGVEPI